MNVWKHEFLRISNKHATIWISSERLSKIYMYERDDLYRLAKNINGTFINFNGTKSLMC